jgi:hypothetical protein
MRWLRTLLLASTVLAAPLFAGCDAGVGSSSDDITDVPHTDVERQSIGNCWLYAQASWVESMHLARTGVKFDTSQSYWTYWHWYDEVLAGYGDEIETGGTQWVSNDLVLDRGIISEAKFVAADTQSEMSQRQASALAKMNEELKTGRLSTESARRNPATVRAVLDDAWQLTPSVKGMLTKAFGKDGQKTLRSGGTPYGAILAADEFQVRYTSRANGATTVKDTTLDVAIDEWRVATYPTYGSNLDQKRRDFQIRVQRALHDRQPVVITWDVDFNAMESSDPTLRGSFNLTTLKKAGKPGRQGGHMTVLEDYEATTQEFGLLAAGVTLDPSIPEDQEKLDAALLPSTSIKFFRVKNSWGAFRDDRSSAPGMPGYHDLYMDYMNGPIAFCPSVEGTKDPATNCKSTTVPFSDVMLPPGY